ncbi:GAS2-like protein 1 [Diceros bicornis minor]|uniref:GAS2-like protein 1 n=1 Tax=Diceros bicornis minor TaxID=77932 RepID=UPI0026EFA0B2|nr:GAS2-like protein 1 [Diceros bicornis minor]
MGVPGFGDAELQVPRGRRSKEEPPSSRAPRRVNVGGGERLPSLPLPSRRSRVCGCVSACVSLAPSHTRSSTSAGSEPAALGSLAPAAALPPLRRRRLCSRSGAWTRPDGTTPPPPPGAALRVLPEPSRARDRRRRPEPRFGSCLSRAARGAAAAAAAAGGGWGCPGGAPSPQGERGAGAQRESPSSPRRAGPCAPRAAAAAAAAAAARASMAPSPRRR